MKKFNLLILFSLIMISSIIVSAGCNMQIINMTWRFQKAHIRGISSSNEWTTVEIASWKDYVDGDVIQIKTMNGKTYLTHYNNVVLEAN